MHNTTAGYLLDNASTLRRREAALLAVLCRQSANGVTVATLVDLAAAAGVNTKSIRVAVDDLVERGAIEVVRPFHPGRPAEIRLMRCAGGTP